MNHKPGQVGQALWYASFACGETANLLVHPLGDGFGNSGVHCKA